MYVNESTEPILLTRQPYQLRTQSEEKESYYYIPSQGKDFELMFNNIYAQKVTINLKYAGDWILIRSMKIIQQGLNKIIFILFHSITFSKSTIESLE